MTDSLRRWLLAAALFFTLLAMLLVRIGSFGIWDPWELNAADAARNLLEGEGVAWNRPPLATWLISGSFDIFGVTEWAGRLPAALGGLLLLGAAFVYARLYGGARGGLYALIVAGTSPLFLFNARQMLGDALAMGTSAWVGVAAAAIAIGPVRTATLEARTPEVAERRPLPSSNAAENARSERRGLLLWGATLVLALPLAMLAAGGLQGLLPPLLAVSAVVLLRPMARERARLIGGGVVVLLTTITLVMVVRAVFVDAAQYDPWLGGAPRGGNPAGFDEGLELVFHSFAPWSALILVALGSMLRTAWVVPRRDPVSTSPGTPPLEWAPRRFEGRLVVVVWAALAYGAQMVFVSRYGSATYLGVLPLAVAVGLLLRDVEDSGRAWWAEAVVGLLFVGLLVRDYALYPGSPVDGLPLDDVTVPEVFNPKGPWTGVMALFALGLLLALLGGEEPKRPELRPGVVAWVKKQWARRGAFRGWLIVGGGILALCLVFGVICWVGASALPFSSLVIRAGRMLPVLPIAAALALFAVPWVLYGVRLLARTRWRMAPLLIGGLVVGAYASQGFLPELSAHFSPREVYDTYNELHAANEKLGEYQVSGRAAAYYAEGDIEELGSQAQLLEFLRAAERRWAVIPTDELPNLNRAYRAQSNKHLYVADARSARMLLVTNQAIEGRPNQNFLVEAVLDEEPQVEHRVGGKFDDRIELIGYDLKTPQPGYVGAGQDVTITWYWRALNSVPGSYKIFLHVDGMGNRMNGDHDPVDEKYPVRLWDEGDIIVDRQTLRVPANYRPGAYTLWIGFYSGNNRLAVTAGTEDEADRLRAGVITVR